MLFEFFQNREFMDVESVLYLMMAYAVILLLVLPVHELAHAYVAHLCGDDTAKALGRLTLNPFKHLDVLGSIMILTVGIGYAKAVPVNTYNLRHGRRDMLLISLAGPMANLLMAVVAVAILRVCYATVISEAVWYVIADVLITITSISVSLAVFNLLPIPPLDGSRLWSTLLPGRWAYMLEANSQLLTYVLFALLCTGVLDEPLSYISGTVINGLFALFGLL